MSYKFYEELKRKRESWSSDHPNCIPFKNLPRFSNHVTLEQGQYNLITASSGVGKSRLVKDLYIHNPINFSRKVPINLDITYFSLEESKDRFYKLELCRQLFDQYGISMDIKELESKGMRQLSESTLNKIKTIEQNYFPKLAETLTVVEERDMESIYQFMLNKAEEKGKIHYKKVGNLNVVDRYECDPLNYTIFIIDHLKLLTGKGSAKELMDKFSSNYLVKLRNLFNFTFVAVQQQAAASEVKKYNNRGLLIENMEPSLSGLGEHKLTQQDANIVMSLYNPYRYGVMNHNGYDVSKIRNKYRALKVLKNRDGISDLSVGLHFNGAAGKFSELPRYNDERINEYYE